jgi:hypothetical protein
MYNNRSNYKSIFTGFGGSGLLLLPSATGGEEALQAVLGLSLAVCHDLGWTAEGDDLSFRCRRFDHSCNGIGNNILVMRNNKICWQDNFLHKRTEN